MNGNNGQFESNGNAVLNVNGEERLVDWKNSVIYDEDGIAIGTMSSGVDVTERKSAEDNLQNAAHTAMLYLDIMGHDIRNHLQAIVMGTDIMTHYELGAEIEPIFELIVDSVENSQKLIDQVQATRELLSTPLERISLSESFDECTKWATEIYHDAEFKITSEVKKAVIMADEFIQILYRNLVDNAVNHNMSKDRVVWISLRESNDGFMVSVQDNGPGVSDERKESLFDAGRRFGGVGLHQAKNIVEKYGGQLSVGDRIAGDSSQGASFDIWLPRIKEDPIEE
jgi:signal transduction histidine kinase